MPAASETSPRSSSDPWEPIVREIVSGLTAAGTSIGVSVPAAAWEKGLDTDGGPSGDVALPAHRFARGAGLGPEELAARLAEAFPTVTAVARARADGAFVNFTILPSRLAWETLSRVFARGERYGHADGPGPVVCVEHTSANPTGPLHVGRVRNGIIGDTLARVLRASGASVTTQYYVDDLGRQSAMITWIWSKPPAQWPVELREAGSPAESAPTKDDARYGKPYPLVSLYLKTHPEAQAELAELTRRIEEGRAPPLHRELIDRILAGMIASLARIGIEFDEKVWESGFVRDGSVGRVMERLARAPNAVREENGARAIDVSSYGLPKDSERVVYQRGDGTSLYVVRDVAYHLAKFGRFQEVVDVLGQDHRLHARTLEALFAELGEPRRPTFVIYQDITAHEGGRMSTRKGSAVWLDELIDEAVHRARAEVVARREGLPPAEIDRIAEAVGTGAIRFHIVRVASEKPVGFRWEDALSFEGRSGPFVQYAYARAASILRKAEVARPENGFDAARFRDPEEIALIRTLSRFPGVVARVARSFHVQLLAGYAHEVADQFNRFYHAVPVLASGDDRPNRLALVAATRQTLGNAIDMLGLVRLETM